jgi:hypothetical protein
MTEILLTLIVEETGEITHPLDRRMYYYIVDNVETPSVTEAVSAPTTPFM